MLARRSFLLGLGAVLTAQPTGRNKTLVVLFQRGAMDGLNAIVPHGEPAYYQLRPRLAIPRSAVIDLDGAFGLHPSLRPLKPLYDQGHLAIVQAAGLPQPTRSHFAAQDFLESGSHDTNTSDGWLNRALPQARSTAPLRAVSFGPNLPHMLRGANPAVAIDDVGGFQVRDAAFEAMYANTRDAALSGTAREAFDAVRRVQAAGGSVAAGVRYTASALGQSLLQIARLIKADVGLEAAFADTNGWDHHADQAARFAPMLSDLALSIAAFYADLGDRMEQVTLVTISEFGRSARENGSRGTDHGHANAMLVLGGGINGGRILGRWPGLAPEQLYEGRDLDMTTDFRDVLGELVDYHFGTRIGQVFPGYPSYRPLGLFV